ncbi:hypothetical protein SDC9_80575 [bioreactor metagenome]|uniref:Uncharacterized protein n=1 Tax=bioreactor metagenome TaxID=1076179 RepID=A0A644Z7C1_9ZZZZ
MLFIIHRVDFNFQKFKARAFCVKKHVLFVFETGSLNTHQPGQHRIRNPSETCLSIAHACSGGKMKKGDSKGVSEFISERNFACKFPASKDKMIQVILDKNGDGVNILEFMLSVTICSHYSDTTWYILIYVFESCFKRFAFSPVDFMG